MSENTVESMLTDMETPTSESSNETHNLRKKTRVLSVSVLELQAEAEVEDETRDVTQKQKKRHSKQSLPDKAPSPVLSTTNAMTPITENRAVHDFKAHVTPATPVSR